MSNIVFNVLRGSIQRTLGNDFVKCGTQLRLHSVSSNCWTKPPINPTTTPPKKSKEVIKVTLLQQDQVVSVMSLDEAQKLARRRDWKLIKVQDFDPKSHRPVYRIATAAELLSEDIDESKTEKSSTTSQTKKTVKSLTIGARISEHDLASRLKSICKWLSKGSEVRILLQGGNSDGDNLAKILQKIETSVKEPEVVGKINQKRTKDNVIKFNILPVVKKDEEPSKA